MGRRLADKGTRVNILVEPLDVNAHVVTINGLSAHAGQNTLVEYAAGVRQSAQNTILIHGEERGALPLLARLKEEGQRGLLYPRPHEVFEL